MLIPSVDMMGGVAVQLVGGEREHLEIDAGDPMPLAKRFGLAGEIAIIDLDAAMGTTDEAGKRIDNRAAIEALLPVAACRVGGGIRDVDTAIRWLNAGAAKVILGTAARPEVLRQLPKDRVIAALDARHGEIVVEGWKTGTGQTILDQVAALKPYVSGFLVTFVEREGRLGGTDLERAQAIVDAAAPVRVTIAGGVTTAEEIAALDAMGADAQVGMAIYSGRLGLADAIIAPARSDRPDGLWPTVIVDEQDRALGLAYSNLESVRRAVETMTGVYWSRSRGGLWQKGATSGATQELLGIALDCDRDTLRFRVRQQGSGFCHLDSWTCWGEDKGIGRLARTVARRVVHAPEGSYTRRLLDDPALLRAKLLEEATELADSLTADEAAWETADVIYFALVTAAARGAKLADIEAHLDARARKVTRRRGDAKARFLK